MMVAVPYKWIIRHRDDLLMALSIMLLAIAVFVFFKTFFDANIDPLATEILAALLGTILTVLITMLLIKRQGTIEQAQEAAATNKTHIFERKLELFREFIACYTRSALDGRLDADELGRLEELALTITLFVRYDANTPPGEDLGEQLCKFILELEVFGLDPSSTEMDPQLLARYFPSHDGLRAAADMVSFVDILQLMKAELGLEMTDEAVDDPFRQRPNQNYWAEKLLCYRDYQRNCETAGGAEARR
ncbi:hypothetical protein [Thiocapsa marina]|uniref:Uncharacterized protein n=1 Tax=Thiocapsa marina 5811 TaxID=768671 RepID=F9UAN4_9GAMM|nr:hypothetical protein [Thiocapsa marina]EGV18786.1 hypothetical protein ThimaDRAFT_2204 [Thiocapsa marina 5811]